MTPEIATGIRFALKFAGGALVSAGYIKDADVVELSGAVIAIVSFIWGVYDARKAKKNAAIVAATPVAQVA